MALASFRVCCLLGILAFGISSYAAEDLAGQVDQARLEQAETDVDNWLTYGRTWAEQRYSPLDQINSDNISNLSLAWAFELDTNRGQEATPIVVDGVMYFSTAWSKVVALDAATGRLLWQYDPEVDGAKAVHACCDVVNRGVAVWKGRVFVGTIDGRLIAVDAKTGKEIWDVVTVDQSKPYTITMAPRVVKDKVIIGNSGAELGVRGYVSAYDTGTGELVWRFYTVPGNPADGPDGAASDDVLARLAAPTWYGEWWKLGGGGTVWDSVVYDAEFDQLIIGIGNGSPWNHQYRSEGKGDNLFLSSILAVNPDTGAYKWHYQANPGESWDFTNTQQITLADLTIDGVPRKVLMQAPKNGFFYVLDRSNGKLISAEPYVYQNWAKRIDKKTGRPVERPEARYKDKPFLGQPSGIGAHAWMPMSYSPDTGLVYIPAMTFPLAYAHNDNFVVHEGRWNTGVNFLDPPEMPGLPKDLAARKKAVAAMRKGELIAWDPIKQEARWKVRRGWPWNGGTLATGGNLVFQGTAHGHFEAYTADRGEKIWSFQTHRGIVAGPIGYRVNGEQYIAVLAGYGGSMGMATRTPFEKRKMPNGIMVAFKLGGEADMPDYTPELLDPPAPSDESFTDAQREAGRKEYMQFCAICHTGPVNPDLRRSMFLSDAEGWESVVLGGAFEANGMASFANYLTEEEAQAIRAYVNSQAVTLLESGATDVKGR
ncbi:PQQ-dependent dehydrogenase, methanol/ethanol family [Emcibacter nanhaiensis]|uniref:PQQ-dependent dehydrogenase, methanol/ethanol family n=2 Tax=Emcibacter nanhaiensis TaxID=1505037 RepID=A0A501PIH4_9PROT|nr:PQQ-dependent dehydrogenase, methanol/ethanol family [Emcibacter nanhaiensis]